MLIIALCLLQFEVIAKKQWYPFWDQLGSTGLKTGCIRYQIVSYRSLQHISQTQWTLIPYTKCVPCTMDLLEIIHELADGLSRSRSFWNAYVLRATSFPSSNLLYAFQGLPIPYREMLLRSLTLFSLVLVLLAQSVRTLVIKYQKSLCSLHRSFDVILPTILGVRVTVLTEPSNTFPTSVVSIQYVTRNHNKQDITSTFDQCSYHCRCQRKQKSRRPTFPHPSQRRRSRCSSRSTTWR